MVQERGRREGTEGRQESDGQQLVLAAIVAGGATVAGMAAPLYLHMGGHTGAEYVGMGAVLISPFVFIVAGLVAFLVYWWGRRLHHVVLAAITAAIVGALSFAFSTFFTAVGGLGAVLVSSAGTVAPAPTVFLSLGLAVAIHRHRSALRGSRVGAAAAAGWRIWTPRMPPVIIALVAGLAAAVPQIVASIVVNFSPPTEYPPSGLIGWTVIGTIPTALVAAWAVLVVLLVDRWAAPRLVRALSAAVFAVVVLAIPPLVLGGGLEHGGEPALLGVLSAVAAAVVVYFSERRVVRPVAVTDLESAEVVSPS